MAQSNDKTFSNMFDKNKNTFIGYQAGVSINGIAIGYKSEAIIPPEKQYIIYAKEIDPKSIEASGLIPVNTMAFEIDDTTYAVQTATLSLPQSDIDKGKFLLKALMYAKSIGYKYLLVLLY